MRILFAGSPAIAVPVFEKLCALHLRRSGIMNLPLRARRCNTRIIDWSQIEIAGVLTNPDTPKGRSKELVVTEVGFAAQKVLQQLEEQSSEKGRAFPVLKPEKLDSSAREQIACLKPDILVTFAYGKIFGPKFLALFPCGGINFHPSLLPKYRGPSPIQAAILNRDSETGISIQKIALEVDCGDILAQQRFQLTGKETTSSLSEVVAQKAASMLEDTLFKIVVGESVASVQNHSEGSYCSLVSREDALINWSRSAADIEAGVRAFFPWPLSRTVHKGKELYILKASIFSGKRSGGLPGQVLDIDKNEGILVQTGEGLLAVTELQYQGKKALFWKDFLNGARDFSGVQLGL